MAHRYIHMYVYTKADEAEKYSHRQEIRDLQRNRIKDNISKIKKKKINLVIVNELKRRATKQHRGREVEK